MAISIKLLTVVGLLVVGITLPVSPDAEGLSRQQNASDFLWCKIGAAIGDSGAADWVTLSNAATHIVPASMQARAKITLSEVPFIPLSNDQVSRYLGTKENTSQGGFPYLVRAAAFYVSADYEVPKQAFGKLPFDVSFSPSRDKLVITNVALGYGGAPPINLALVVDAPQPISQLEAVCKTTQ